MVTQGKKRLFCLIQFLTTAKIFEILSIFEHFQKLSAGNPECPLLRIKC